MARAVAPTSMRLDPELKAALERAAHDDERSVSSLTERILRAWLMEHGYLPKAPGAKAARRKTGTAA